MDTVSFTQFSGTLHALLQWLKLSIFIGRCLHHTHFTSKDEIIPVGTTSHCFTTNVIAAIQSTYENK